MGLASGLGKITSKILGKGSKLGPKGSARALRRKAAKKRLNRMNRKKMFRNMAEGALQGGGFDTNAMSQSKGGSGKLLRQMGIGSGSESGFDVTLPPMDTPPKVSKESGLSLSSLNNQYNQLLKTAVKIGAVSKEQQLQTTATPIEIPGTGDLITPEAAPAPLEIPRVKESIAPKAAAAPLEIPRVKESIAPKAAAAPLEIPRVKESITAKATAAPLEIPRVKESITAKATAAPLEIPRVKESIAPKAAPAPIAPSGTGDSITPEATVAPIASLGITPKATATRLASQGAKDLITPKAVTIDELFKAIAGLDKSVDNKIKKAQAPRLGEKMLDRALQASESDTGVLAQRTAKAKLPKAQKAKAPTKPDVLGKLSSKKESNSSLSIIEKQLDEIVKTAVKIGAISKEQQEQLIKQTKDAEALSKEKQTESPATSIETPGAGDSITPGSSAVDDLLKAIAGLNESIDDKIREAQAPGLGGGMLAGALAGGGFDTGFLDERRAKAKLPKLQKGYTRVAGGQFRGPDGKLAKAENALKNFKKVDPKFLNQTAKLRQAEALAKPGVLGKLSSKAAATMKGGVAKAGAKVAGKVAGAKLAGSALKATVAKVAKPLVLKSLAKTGLKSIPIVGALAGGLFAISRLMSGDVVGAGLEAASGLGGPLTAIPALVLSLARDVYTGVFGKFPESDPQVGERMTVVKTGVEDLVKESLGKKVEKNTGAKKKPATSSKLASTPSKPASKPAGTKTGGSPPSSSPAPSMGSSGGAAPSSSPSSGGGGGSGGGGSGGGGGGGATPAKSEVSESPVKQEPITGISPGPSMPEAPSDTKSGAAIAAASGQGSMATQVAGNNSTSLPMPSFAPTSRPDATGMGDVPEPTYMNAGELIKGMYFGAVAGAMA